MKPTETDESRRPARKCLRCAGATVTGTIGSAQTLVFSTPPKSFLSIGASSPVEATCCQVCGEVSLYATNAKKFATEVSRASQEKL
jgi:hypothetical protein